MILFPPAQNSQEPLGTVGCGAVGSIFLDTLDTHEGALSFFYPQPTSLLPHQHKVASIATSSSSIFRKERPSLSFLKKTKLEVRPSHPSKPG